ncbi:hypothetical protein [Pseudarthrobacter cellobiosi]|uniref:hypothetical protein n=1 Tax=Pseudarthrobacter cellobiosi TaxID=2953654 RepID=UPI00208ECC7D|nr:hypothetical protein [Pseudarthrobacter sp. HLT1-5]MCO4254751.1 hypothetical protein [Pseudarthrobacter sp. HLT1-5]
MGLVALVLVHLFGEVVLNLIVGPSYTYVLALKLQLAAAVLSNVGQYLSWLHLLNVKSSRIRNVSVLAATTGTMVSFYLISKFGLTGAGVGILLSFFIYAVLMSFASPAGARVRPQIFAYALASLAAVFVDGGLFVGLMAGLAVAFSVFSWRAYRRIRPEVDEDREAVASKESVGPDD